MSLEEDNLKEEIPKDPEVQAAFSALDLTQKQLDHVIEIAKSKESVGLPLSDKDRFALKMARLQKDLKRKKD